MTKFSLRQELQRTGFGLPTSMVWRSKTCWRPSASAVRTSATVSFLLLSIFLQFFLKYYNLPVTIIATKSDKIKNSERAKCKKVILDTLNLQKGDKLIVTSSEKREGLGLVLQTLDDVIALHNNTDSTENLKENE